MSFDKPFKLRVLEAMCDVIKEITPANGYVHDLADYDPGDGFDTERVVRGRAWFGEDDPLPMISLLEGIDPASEVAEPPADTVSADYDWPLLIQGWIKDDKSNPTDPAYVLLADVRRRLAQEVHRKLTSDSTERDIFGLREEVSDQKNQVVELRIGPGVVRPADDVSSTSWFWMSVVVRVFENAAFPYD